MWFNMPDQKLASPTHQTWFNMPDQKLASPTLQPPPPPLPAFQDRHQLPNCCHLGSCKTSDWGLTSLRNVCPIIHPQICNL